MVLALLLTIWSAVIVHKFERGTTTDNNGSPLDSIMTATDHRHHRHSEGPHQQKQQQNLCRPNAIVYLTQKHHSSYDRDSYGLFLKSLDLLFENYLNDHYANATVLVFHTGDFTDRDLQTWEKRYPPATHGTIQLRDLLNTTYWKLPAFLENDNPKKWFLPDYTVGYRHMMRWYAKLLYDYLRNEEGQADDSCRYQYVMRMDEESFIYSKINYDLFGFMSTNRYDYGFRQCSFEMRHMRPLWEEYTKDHPLKPKREFLSPTDLCGFYNNWFIARIDMFFQPDFRHWLQWMDQSGYIYRKRINDLIIHTSGVYAFVDTDRIHRFLDFTYEHFTNYKKSQCPLWGAISGGYNDPNAHQRIAEYIQRELVDKACPKPYEKKPYFPRILNLTAKDLSPTYHHLPPHLRDTLSLPEVAAGHVDLANAGIRSG